jgi:integrase
MPTRYKSPIGIRWRAVVKILGRVAATRLFGTGPQEKRAAQTWELEKRKELTKTRTRSDSPDALEWSNRYCEFSRQNHSSATLRAKIRTLKKFLTFLRSDDLSIVTPAVVMEYLQREARARSGHAANSDRKELAAAWKWGERYLTGFPRVVNPFLAVEKFKEVRSPRYVPEEGDFWKVVTVAQGQDKCILLAFFYLGARRGEIFRLKWEDVDFGKNQVRLGTYKTAGGSMRFDWMPLAAELKAALLDWKERRPFKTPWVFASRLDSVSPFHNGGEPYRSKKHTLMRKLCKKAGVKPFGFHAIRHLHASILFNEGGELSVIQRQLRHTNPNTTVRYLRTLGYAEEHRRKVLAVIEGRQSQAAAVFQFPLKGNPQGGDIGDSVNSPGAQTGTGQIT